MYHRRKHSFPSQNLSSLHVIHLVIMRYLRHIHASLSSISSKGSLHSMNFINTYSSTSLAPFLLISNDKTNIPTNDHYCHHNPQIPKQSCSSTPSQLQTLPFKNHLTRLSYISTLTMKPFSRSCSFGPRRYPSRTYRPFTSSSRVLSFMQFPHSSFATSFDIIFFYTNVPPVSFSYSLTRSIAATHSFPQLPPLSKPSPCTASWSSGCPVT